VVRHSKDRALTEREYERVLQAVERIDDGWYRNVTRFIVVVAGRLGLRAGEIAHMHREWVDFRSGIIVIPEHQRCTKSASGGPCGYCRSLAKSVVDHAVPTVEESKLHLLEQGQLVDLGMVYQELLASFSAFDSNHIPKEDLDDRVQDALAIGHDGPRDPFDAYQELCHRAEKHRDRHNVTLDEAIDQYWIPKTAAAARQVPFDFSSRAEMAIEDFFDVVDRYPNSRTTVNRRVDDALVAAGFDKNYTSPHGLRATAATFHAGRGLDVIPMQSMFGWVQMSTAMKYINSSGANTQRALNSIH